MVCQSDLALPERIGPNAYATLETVTCWISVLCKHRRCKMAEKIFQNIPAVSDIVDMQLKVTIEEE
jgi:pentatricopeptide repeat protein